MFTLLTAQSTAHQCLSPQISGSSGNDEVITQEQNTEHCFSSFQKNSWPVTKFWQAYNPLDEHSLLNDLTFWDVTDFLQRKSIWYNDLWVQKQLFSEELKNLHRISFLFFLKLCHPCKVFFTYWKLAFMSISSPRQEACCGVTKRLVYLKVVIESNGQWYILPVFEGWCTSAIPFLN